MQTELDKAISEVKREVALRERVYPRWIQQGRLSAEDAERQTGRMKSALAALERLRRIEQPDLFA